MVFLASLIEPSIGLVFWTFLAFAILWTLLAKFAWRPIQEALKVREDSINNSLKEAEKARAAMASLKSDNEKILQEAKEERNQIIKEARDIKEDIVTKAKEQARSESLKMIENAKLEIENQKMAAIMDVKNQIGTHALQIAKGVLKRELDSQKKHEDFITDEVKKINLN